eukprot:2530896-Rhodomonas_salina.3
MRLQQHTLCAYSIRYAPTGQVAAHPQRASAPSTPPEMKIGSEGCAASAVAPFWAPFSTRQYQFALFRAPFSLGQYQGA